MYKDSLNNYQNSNLTVVLGLKHKFSDKKQTEIHFITWNRGSDIRHSPTEKDFCSKRNFEIIKSSQPFH